MSKKLGSRKKPTKSRPSPSTRRLNAFTLTSSLGPDKQLKHRQLATELLIQSLSPAASSKVEEAIVDGISMWPILRPGYRIRFRAVNPESLSPGELIVVEMRGKQGEKIQRVHRFIGRVGPLFLEAGDNTFTASLVTGQKILGRVEAAFDSKGKAVVLPEWNLERSRFRYFLVAAQAFMFTHELKDRMLGQRRSLLLWKASQAYRFGLNALGLEVPTLFPKP